MIKVAEALQILRKHRAHWNTEVIPLDRALGRTLAQDVAAPFRFPQFDNSAMDGFAVGSREGPWEIVGEVRAGSASPPALNPCEAVRIFTGAPVPSRTYGVIPQEEAHQNHDMISGAVTRSRHIRFCGEEVEIGSEVLREGCVLNPPHLAALAACGLATVEVLMRGKVKIISTGDEVVEPGQELRFGQIYNSNAAGLVAALKSWGLDVTTQHIEDCSEPLQHAMFEAWQANQLVITTGGVSVGAYDLVKSAAEAAGFQVAFHGVAVKPGKPISVGFHEKRCAWLGLPGNPLSTWVGLLIFVAAWIGRELPVKSRQLSRELLRKGGREEFLLATESPDGRLSIRETVGSHANFALLGCTGFVRVSSDVEHLFEGDAVEYRPFPWGEN